MIPPAVRRGEGTAPGPGAALTTPAHRTERFLALDALRGAAAIFVMLFHYRDLLPGLTMGHAYLAVDFFFMLSGFVIAHAYEQRLRAGQTWNEFMRLRLIRLLPMVAAGVALGAAYMIVRSHFEPERVSVAYILLAFLFGILLLPVSPILGGDPYPLDGPTWSLFFEITANAAWAAFRGRLVTPALVAIALAWGAVLAWSAATGHWNPHGSDFPWNGFARAGFGFFAGCLLFRWRDSPGLGWIPTLPTGAGILLLLAVSLPPLDWPDTYNLAIVTIILPIIVLGAARFHGEKYGRWEAMLGWLSYPLYTLHIPAMLLVLGSLKAAHLYQAAPAVLTGIASIFMALSLSALLGAFYDDPIRRKLSRRSSTTIKEIARQGPF